MPPHASDSSPRSSRLNAGAQEWYPPGYAQQPANSKPSSSSAAPTPTYAGSSGDDASLELAELPGEILSCVVARMDAPEDVCRCLMVSTQLQGAVRTARMRLALTDALRQRLGYCTHEGSLDQLVAALTRYMPAMRACDLSSLPLDHAHISTLASGLQHLEHLDLSGCRKLQPSVTQQLFQELKTRRLRSLNLQRCFQLTEACLTHVLVAQATGSSTRELQCFAMSHLALAAWPPASGAAPAGPTGAADGAASNSASSSWQQRAAQLLLRLPRQLVVPPPVRGAPGLRVLALNNCSMLTAEGLAALAVACPQLEYVFLGGSMLQTPRLGAAASAGGSVAGAGGDGPAGAYVPPIAAAARGVDAAAAPLELPAALQQLAQLLCLPESLPWEQLSSCCDPSAGAGTCCSEGACACTCACCSRSRLLAQQQADGASGGGSTGEHQRASKRLCRNEPSAAAVASARAQALALTYMAALLPNLRAMEVSLMSPGVAGWLRVCMQRLQQRQLQGVSGGGRDGSAAPRVWQFSCVTDVADALQVLQDARQAHSRRHASGGRGEATGAAPIDPACLELAVSCAANCSGRGRSTPLHLAADSGCACHVAALCAAGARVHSRDGSGATPLFVAAEAGKVAATGALLAAGADWSVRNTAGEAPLYIAALRGHLGVVELLLGHLQSAAGGSAAGPVDWTQRNLYGDAWTPLMAAAVANRVSVAQCLLRAAAMLCCGQQQQKHDSGSTAAAAVNTSRHAITSSGAASGTAVMRLLAAENRYGQTVLHIAARKGCRELLQLLLCYGAGRVAGRVVDSAGDTPLDIARRHGHDVAVRELLQQC